MSGAQPCCEHRAMVAPVRIPLMKTSLLPPTLNVGKSEVEKCALTAEVPRDDRRLPLANTLLSARAGVGWDLAHHCGWWCSHMSAWVREDAARLLPSFGYPTHSQDTCVRAIQDRHGVPDFSCGDEILSTVNVYSRPNKTKSSSHPHNPLTVLPLPREYPHFLDC